MDERFRLRIEGLHRKFEQLRSMPAVSFRDVQKDEVDRSGVYLLSEGDQPLYIGRSRNIRNRLASHGYGSHNGSPFAFKLARAATGNLVASYSKPGSRPDLMSRPEFSAAFRAAKARIRAMSIRFVDEPEPVAQALLEIYATVALDTPYNDFDTH
jgi:hypothetical protein